MSKLTLNFILKTETKTCYRFEHSDTDDFVTLYLKKKQLKAAGIDPKAGITVTVEQRNES